MKFAFPHFIEFGEPLDMELEKIPEDDRLTILEDFLYHGKAMGFFNGEEEVLLTALDFSEKDLKVIEELYRTMEENLVREAAIMNAWWLTPENLTINIKAGHEHKEYVGDLETSERALEEGWFRFSFDGSVVYINSFYVPDYNEINRIEDFIYTNKLQEYSMLLELITPSQQYDAQDWLDLKEQLDRTASIKTASINAWITDNGRVLRIRDESVTHEDFIDDLIEDDSKPYRPNSLEEAFENWIRISADGDASNPYLSFPRKLTPSQLEWVEDFLIKYRAIDKPIAFEMSNGTLQASNFYDLKEQLEGKTASYIDFPHEDLAEDIWNKKDGSYIMKSGVKDQILKPIYQYLSKYDGEDKWLLQILFGSSLTTQFYNNQTDIDIKLVMDFDKFLKMNPDVQKLVTKSGKSLGKLLVKDLRKTFKNTKINGRELDVYAYQFSDVILIKYDSLYNILNDTWIKEPNILDLTNYNKLIDYIRNEILELAESYANKIDLDLGKLRRRVIELTSILKLFKDKWKPKELKALKEQIKTELDAIELSIANLDMDEETVSGLRNKLFEKMESEFTIKTDLSDIFDNLNWLPENLIFKFLQKWGYVSMIKQLGDLLDDDNKISLENVQEIQNILGIK